jgi:hypothetical protein
MKSFFAVFSGCFFLPLRRPVGLTLCLAAAVLLTASSHAQFGPPDPGTKVLDAGALTPPVGARVAIIEFLDLQCPDCAKANPMVKDAVAKYKIPWLRHDFTLPFHSWSRLAAIDARWFDLTSPDLGNEYRDRVFAEQPTIKDVDGLRLFTEKFARENGLTLPQEVDPDGKLATLVKTDYALGQRIGVEHTPTIWVVTAGSKGAPFVEVVDHDKLFEMIEQALKQTAR